MTVFGADDDLVQLVQQFFAAEIDHDLVIGSQHRDMSRSLWSKVSALGLPWVGVDEACGGSGGRLEDQMAIQFFAGMHAAPLPLLDGYLAGMLCQRHGVDVKAPHVSTMFVGTENDSWRVDGDRFWGELHDVTWVSDADFVVGIAESDEGSWFVRVPVADCRVDAGFDLIGQSRGSISCRGVAGDFRPALMSAEEVACIGSLLRASTMAGAMASLSTKTTEFALTREQFGRPIAEFQSVQVHLVELAEWSHLVGLAVGAAVLDGQYSQTSIKKAKLLANLGAAAVSKAAHQVYGAIGVTRECELQDYTRRLSSWRVEFGDEIALSAALGQLVEHFGLYASVVGTAGQRVS